MGMPALDKLEDSRTHELVLRLQAGEAGAWDELYRVYRDELLFYVRSRLGTGLRSDLQSEDIFQSVALEAFRALPRFEHRGQGSLRKFLHTLILNKIRDRADAAGAVKRAGTIALDSALESQLCQEDPRALHYHDPAYEQLERALGLLDPTLREVVLLRRLEGCSYSELAQRLGKSELALRKLYSRALAQLTLSFGEERG